jgi:hypothetical protein
MPAHRSAVIDPIAAGAESEGFRSWQWSRPHNLPSLGALLHVGSRTQLSTRSKKQATSPFLIKPKMIDISWLLRT